MSAGTNLDSTQKLAPYDMPEVSLEAIESLELRRVRDSVPNRLWVVALIGFWERAAFWGLTAPWQNYMQNPIPKTRGETPGALGLGQAMATRIYCCFYIFYYVTPILVALVADNWLGHYTTLVVSSIVYCLGIAVLTISSVPAYLESGWGLPGLISAMVLIGLGGAGVKSIMPPFLADQYTAAKPQIRTLKSGEKVITDRELTLQYIYNLYFWIGNIGSLSWFATVFLEEHSGFTAAYALTLGLMVVALLMLILGKQWYIMMPRGQDNVFRDAIRIITCAIKHGWKMDNAMPEYQRTHRNNIVPWSERTVDELTRGLRACRVLLAFVVFYVCFDQMQNNLISQAGQMSTKGTPNDLLPAMNQVGCIVIGPIVQMCLYPLLHQRRIYLKPITRITIGFAFIAVAMLYATVVQHIIYSSPPCYSFPEKCPAVDNNRSREASRPNIWIQAPVYFLIATGEIFAYTTALEYAYDHAPKDMKAVVQAISLLMGGIGSAIALALTAVAHDPNLLIFYASLSGAMAITTLFFWVVFRKYDKQCVFDGEPHSSVVQMSTESEKSAP